MARLKVTSLFCGCGGMDLGLLGGFDYLGQSYPELDFEIVKAIDNDPYCTKIYNHNFKHHCEVMDVRSLEIAELPDHDVLIGGFPCQSFSISAQNPPRLGYKDERGMLFFEMVKILKEKKPRFLIAENVKGLLSANKGKAFPMIIQEFERAGYHIKFKLFNASEFGIPQKRERVIIVGFREYSDYAYFSFPKPTTPINKVPLRCVINESDNFNDCLFFSEKAVAGMMAVRDKMNKGRAQSLDEPCNTISSHLAKVSLNSTDPVLFINGRYRRFSSNECARIQSFPESFLWESVSEAKQLKAIGNAVPPVLMWHIANALALTANRPNQSDIKPIEPASYEYANGDWTQLSLFEPETVYISKQDNEYILVGTCRRGIIDWIRQTSKYCYPVSEDDLLHHPELLNISRLVIRHKKSVIGCFEVTAAEVVVKQELNAYGYPTRSSRRKADAKYLLLSLKDTCLGIDNLDFTSFKPIIGKGVR
ncbi:MAG: DNA (cytosine-5-)-methyltransferase [Pseudoflavonifractor sp.]|nr:DNA (cytosine-5-)-methyltransferase [Alloprevotella sp.]MCM1116144.1 DNA (cytosine-5-)-methyltransferase [Pseudoflavonifractor sp.]